jgi:DNA-binding LacI/PurR family transcriptional regulator
MAVTRKDVALRAEVSTATVSNVVNRCGSVSSPVRQRVIDAINELGYQPNQIARSLKTNQTNEIALFSSDIMNPYYAEVACGIEEYAREKGYLVCIVTTDIRDQHKKSFFSRQFDGIIVQSIHISVQDLVRWAERNIPVILITGSEKWEGVPASVTQITIDIKAGARKLFEYLIRLGHRRIAFIAAQAITEQRTNDARLEAYQEVLAEHGIEYDPALIFAELQDLDSIYQYMKAILSIDTPPSAIFTGNDNYALVVLAAIRDSGLSVPEDISVIGYDNILASAYYAPPLTTVGIPKYSLGHIAAEMLLRKIQGEQIEDKTIATELIERYSVREIHR